MNRLRIGWLIAACAVCGSSAAAQGTFGHIAVGGGWHMTITLVNLLPSATTAQVTFFSDTGSALVVGATGQTANSQYSMNIPATGSAKLVLPDQGPLLSGWAKVTASNNGVLRGQADFVYHPAPGTNWEGVVPLTPDLASTGNCILPLPLPTAGTISFPFDQTSGSAVGLALSNVTQTAQQIQIVFVDANNATIVSDTISLGPLNHTAFMLNDKYPALANSAGTLRITGTTQVVSALALQASPDGGFTTLLPIYQ